MIAAVGVGRVVPELVAGPRWPYALLGAAFAALAGLTFAAGLERHRQSSRALQRGEFAPLDARWVEVFTVAGLVLAAATIAVIVL